MSVGMTANLGLLHERPLQILGLVVGLIAVKMSILWLLARFTRHAHDDARGMAFALPQAGEFGFVLFSLAVAQRVLDPSLAEILVIVVTLSMMASPLLITLHARVIEPRSRKAPAREFDKIESNDSRVIIAGIGRFGQVVGRILRLRRVPFTAIDVSVEQIDLVRRFGNKAYYGDVSRLELLHTAGAHRAELFVLAIDDVEASLRTAELLRRHFPHVKILARARNRQHALRLMDLDVRYIVRETYYSSLDLARQALEAMGVSRERAEQTIERFRENDRKLLLAQQHVRHDEDKLIQTSQQAAAELERIFESDEAAERASS
jgi:voltage-gated potassium channel Kch